MDFQDKLGRGDVCAILQEVEGFCREILANMPLQRKLLQVKPLRIRVAGASALVLTTDWRTATYDIDLDFPGNNWLGNRIEQKQFDISRKLNLYRCGDKSQPYPWCDRQLAQINVLRPSLLRRTGWFENYAVPETESNASPVRFQVIKKGPSLFLKMNRVLMGTFHDEDKFLQNRRDMALLCDDLGIGCRNELWDLWRAFAFEMRCMLGAGISPVPVLGSRSTRFDKLWEMIAKDKEVLGGCKRPVFDRSLRVNLPLPHK